MKERKDYNDSVGRTYNKLTVKKLLKKGNGKIFLCECECGNIVELRPICVVSGHNKSCGCIVNKHGLWKHPLYNIWKAMKNRCLNPNDKDYESYGGRGITMNPDWTDVKKYIEDIESVLGKRPKGMTIDRIDNNRGYYIDNLRYATSSQQNINKRYNNKLGVEYKNIFKSKNGYEVRVVRLKTKRYAYLYNLEDTVKLRDLWIEEYDKNPEKWLERTNNKKYKEDINYGG